MSAFMRHLAAVTALAVLAACSQPADDSTVLHRGNRTEPLSLDPHVAVIMDIRTIIADLFVGLYQPGPDGRPVNALAESVSVSEDGLVWTFQLREARWSDGEAITARDVVGGLQRAVDPLTRNQYPVPLYMIENAQPVAEGRLPVEDLGVRALDDRTVEIRLEHTAPYLPSVLMYWGQPVPVHAIDRFGDTWIRPENIVTSGAYHLTEWRTGNFVHLTANPEFFDAGEVCLSEVYYYSTTDTSSAERQVRSGELDLNIEFAGANLEFLTARYPEMVRIGSSVDYRNITFNTSAGPFADPRVRRALSMAIDRDFIARDVLGGADSPANRLVADGIAGRADGVSLDFADRAAEVRRDDARRLLEEAGYGEEHPLSFTFHYVPSAGWPRVAPVIQQDWADIAPWVQVELEVRETQLHYDAMRVGDFVAASSGWVPDFDDPYAYLLLYESRAGEINYSRWVDPQFDALLAEALNEADMDRRSALLGEAEQILLDAAPAAPVFFQNTKQLIGPRVEGWVPNPAAINISRWLCVADADG